MISYARRLLLPVLSLAFTVVIVNSCKHKPNTVTEVSSGYPDAVAKIIVNKCVSCHNSANASGAANLRLDTWDHLFYGGSHGAVIVPYDPVNSSLLYFINTDSSLGIVATPTMPFDPIAGNPQGHLTREEYMTIRNWVEAGAPNDKGEIPFASNPDTRQKFYMTQQGCDMLTVVDAERKVVMRNIKIGEEPTAEIPHCVRVSNDGAYAYVSFTAGNYIQKIDTRTDQIVGRVKLETNRSAEWNILQVSEDGTKVAVSDLKGGMINFINTADMTVIGKIDNPAICKEPHGIAANAAFDTFYVTAQYGNIVYRIKPDGYVRPISINGAPPVNRRQYHDPHEIMLTPDYSKYFLTCEASNQVRVMSTRTDKALDSFSVPTKPQEMAMSRVKPYLFVSCMEGPDNMINGVKTRGSIVVINYETMKIVKVLEGQFFQPHGLAVDDQRQLLLFVNRNAAPDGQAPHHTSECGGANGWYNVYDINTLEPANNIRYEVLADPYSVDVRFKH